jgi:hypothetical protein
MKMILKELLARIQEGLDSGEFTEDMPVCCLNDESGEWYDPYPSLQKAYGIKGHDFASSRPYKEYKNIIPIISL